MSRVQNKPFKSLDNQMIHLQNNKQIIFSNPDDEKRFLLDNNYYNVITCGKIKYAQSIDKGAHVYNVTDFKDWISYYQIDVKISCYLMPAMLDFEKKLNSRIAYFISEIMEERTAVPVIVKNRLNELIIGANIENLPLYSKKETWTYITKMSFGDMKKLLLCLDENKSNVVVMTYLNQILDGFKLKPHDLKSQIDELNNLRNQLFHFTPLNIFLSYGQTGKKPNIRFSNTRRKKAIDYVLSLRPNNDIRKELSDLYTCSDKFVKIKNTQLQKQLSDKIA